MGTILQTLCMAIQYLVQALSEQMKPLQEVELRLKQTNMDVSITSDTTPFHGNNQIESLQFR